MKASRIFLSGIFLCALLLSPSQTNAQISVSEETHRAILIELIHTLQKQIAILQAELESQQSVIVTPANETIPNFSDSVAIIAKYSITKVADVSSISNREQREYFERVFEIFPAGYDDKVIRAIIFDGKNTEFDAFVETVPPEHESWLYAVNEEIIKDENSGSNTELIVHELAHIISYEEIIGMPKPSSVQCDNYFDVHGCPSSNSYLKQFVDNFWSTSDLDRAEQFSELPDSFDDVYSYYRQHGDEYVTDYAASAPEEDFAESFMFFVLENPVKRGTTARQKVDFFKQYSDLLMVRKDILENR